MQNTFTAVCNSKAVVYALVYQPHDVVAVTKQKLIFLLCATEFAVGHIIADEFAAVHSERVETVAVLPSAHCQFAVD